MNRSEGRQSRTWVRRLVISIVVVVTLLGVLGAGAAILWNEYGERISLALGWTSNDFSGGGNGTEVTVVIRSGHDGTDIANTLESEGVVKTPEAFIEVLEQQEPEVVFHPGAFRLQQEMSAQAALDALLDPENELDFRVTIPEGLTVAQTLTRISDQSAIPLEELEAVAADTAAFALPEGVDSLEGWLFPATYEFEIDTSAEAAVHQLFDTQVRMLDDLGIAEADRERVLTIASIVQREAGRMEDFGKVSRVIANRLDAGMMLQMDSTAQYGVGQHTDGDVWSTEEALTDENPWNTYVHTGLPQGPIANPGRDALEATLAPEPGEWLYFVAVNLDTGESVFTTTVDEHEAAVDTFREWCAANPGKGC